jgi:hypothetical protein
MELVTCTLFGAIASVAQNYLIGTSFLTRGELGEDRFNKDKSTVSQLGRGNVIDTFSRQNWLESSPA